jgi:thioredoxin-dependent peroxiredoxin
MAAGCSFDGVLRIVGSFQLPAHHRVATLVKRQPGPDVIIAGSVSDDEAQSIYP